MLNLPRKTAIGEPTTSRITDFAQLTKLPMRRVAALTVVKN